MTDVLVITPCTWLARDRWIPVGRLLPETLHDVLITYSDGGPHAVDIAYRRRDGTWVLSGSDLVIQPIAWMPLPAPADAEVGEDET